MRSMKLEGIHHITAITGDAPRNVDFYVRLLGLRMVKKSVNQDDPTVYHLFYADEHGSAGSDLTFFEYPNARIGRAGAGMVHRIVHRVGSAETLSFWEDRFGAESVAVERVENGLRFADFEGLQHELRVVDVPDPPLASRSTEVPAEHALLGFHEVHACRRRSAQVREAPARDAGVRGDRRRTPSRRAAPRAAGRSSSSRHRAAASVAPGRSITSRGLRRWTTTRRGGSGWLRPASQVTPVIDRFYFRSIYSREPGGILYEIATIGPGFATDEPAASLGESLALPPEFEHLREQVEPLLTPLPDVRQWRPTPARS